MKKVVMTSTESKEHDKMELIKLKDEYACPECGGFSKYKSLNMIHYGFLLLKTRFMISYKCEDCSCVWEREE